MRDTSDAQSRVPNYMLCNNDTMRKATRNVGQLYDNAIAPSGLRNTQFGILVHIDELEEPTMKDLAAELVMDLSALGQSLKPLTRDGYVRLVPNLTDGRSKRVTLTKVGQRKVAETMPLWSAAQRRLEAVFGEDRAALLREAFTALSSADFSAAFLAYTDREPAG